MNSELPATGPASNTAAAPPTSPASAASSTAWQRFIFAPVKFIIGMIFCQSPFGALAVIGWTQRLMQRTVLKQWWARSEFRRQGGSFESFLLLDFRTRNHLGWPNWIVAQDFRGAISPAAQPPGGRLAAMAKALFTSLWNNIRLGLQGLLNIWLFTLPGGVLMGFGWYDGWNNSFNKGYEQAFVGPLTVFIGMVLFTIGMLYVPMAHARQAVTGDWRSFYQFGLIRQLIRRSWFENAVLAALYLAVSLPVLALVIMPQFFPQIRENMLHLPPVEPERVVPILKRYFLGMAAFFLPAWVALRWLAARIYGSVLARSVQSGAIAEEALADVEWQALHRLDLLRVAPARSHHRLVRAIAWAGTKTGRFAAVTATVLIWLAFNFSLFLMAQFFHYRGMLGGLNNPLVQLPWILHLPPRLQNPWQLIGVTAFVLFLIWMGSRIVKRVVGTWRKNSGPISAT